MVANTRKALRNNPVKPLNLPKIVSVEEKSDGTPVALRTKRLQRIVSIEDKWRVDDEWWRSEPTSRLYFAVVLASGLRHVIYKDLVKNEWYRQSN